MLTVAQNHSAELAVEHNILDGDVRTAAAHIHIGHRPIAKGTPHLPVGIIKIPIRTMTPVYQRQCARAADVNIVHTAQDYCRIHHSAVGDVYKRVVGHRINHGSTVFICADIIAVVCGVQTAAKDYLVFKPCRHRFALVAENTQTAEYVAVGVYDKIDAPAHTKAHDAVREIGFHGVLRFYLYILHARREFYLRRGAVFKLKRGKICAHGVSAHAEAVIFFVNIVRQSDIVKAAVCKQRCIYGYVFCVGSLRHAEGVFVGFKDFFHFRCPFKLQ